MYKTNAAGTIMMVLGFVAAAVAVLASLWPLWVGLVLLFLAYRLVCFLGDTGKVLATKLARIRERILSEPRLAEGELSGVSQSTAAR